MENRQLTRNPVVKAGMLIRRPVAEVFEAFVNPEITSNFWFTWGSGRLEAGKQIKWQWEMYNVAAIVDVRLVEVDKRILIDWGDPEVKTTVEWNFIPYNDDKTFVSITNSGFEGNGDTVVDLALDATGGFTTVLDGAKAWLEFGIRLNLIEDKFPKGLTEHGK